ncbi:helix-turn-helix transcriptional regulator [Actinomycetospora sp. CA-101289]|uniref:helix-turn-helix transcriptional regulator n=1 Tax=Actinomycetospora sp. CA-101289 TaxID=3239893 RepID=UPI003D96BA47
MEAVVARPQPVTRYRWASTDPDEATEYLRATYTDFRPPRLSRDGFEFWTDVASAGPFAIGRLRRTGVLRMPAEPTPELVVVQTLAGGPHHVDDGREQTAGTLKLTPTWSAYDTGWSDVTVQTVVLDPVEVARVGADLSGLDPDAVAFDGMCPRSPTLATYWARLCTHVRETVLSSDDLMAAPLVRAGAQRQLASALLATFPNTVRDALEDPVAPGTGRAEPATVRRAVEYVDAHAHEDIGLTDIATAARIGPRSLQLAFRRHRDTTPVEYLRRVRLERAHRDLQQGDPTRGDRVEAIAARWGFAHPGRFSVLYREHYGRSPSATLRG